MPGNSPRSLDKDRAPKGGHKMELKVRVSDRDHKLIAGQTFLVTIQDLRKQLKNKVSQPMPPKLNFLKILEIDLPSVEPEESQVSLRNSRLLMTIEVVLSIKRNSRRQCMTLELE